MNDCSWMYRDSPKGFYMNNYCKRVEGFINFTLLNLNNISGDEIRCPCTKYKNKKFHQSDVVMMHLLKKKVGMKILMLICTKKNICSL